jgi:regulatory protein
MPATTPSLKGRALRHLSAREHSRVELERKLRPFEEEPGQVERVLDELTRRDLISESRVIESVLHRRQDRLGGARLRQELARKGIDRDSVDHAIDTLKCSELERARLVLQKKFGPSEGEPDPQERARQLRFLASRGFSGDVARRAVKSGQDDDVPPDD